MRISVRLLHGKSIMLEVQPNDNVQNVKKQIQSKEHIQVDLQKLVYADALLDNKRSLASYGIGNEAILQLVLGSAQKSKTIAGGYGQGNALDEFCFPYGITVQNEDTIVVADWGNHRIVQWKIGDTNGKVIAGGHGQGKALHQLSCPTDVLIDKETKSVIICDRGNKRIVQWSLQDGTTEGKLLLENIACWGLAMDNQRFLYISDTEKHEVRRYKLGDTKSDRVAGGNGRGASFKQLNGPSYIFVGQNQTVYVADTWNQRVMKWAKDAQEGIVAARGFPRGLYVDGAETIFMADYGHHQIMRWPKDATEGTVVKRANDESEETNDVYYPWALAIDQHGHLLVADHSNQCVQRFSLSPTN